MPKVPKKFKILTNKFFSLLQNLKIHFLCFVNVDRREKAGWTTLSTAFFLVDSRKLFSSRPLGFDDLELVLINKAEIFLSLKILGCASFNKMCQKVKFVFVEKFCIKFIFKYTSNINITKTNIF